MSHVKAGHMIASGEWRKHLRRWYKRAFWKRHRRAEKLSADANDGRAGKRARV
ncbi:MAG: hypothetical protein AB7L41_11160 [Flavobacteriaceae bacterium]